MVWTGEVRSDDEEWGVVWTGEVRSDNKVVRCCGVVNLSSKDGADGLCRV